MATFYLMYKTWLILIFFLFCFISLKKILSRWVRFHWIMPVQRPISSFRKRFWWTSFLCPTNRKYSRGRNSANRAHPIQVSSHHSDQEDEKMPNSRKIGHTWIVSRRWRIFSLIEIIWAHLEQSSPFWPLSIFFPTWSKCKLNAKQPIHIPPNYTKYPTKIWNACYQPQMERKNTRINFNIIYTACIFKEK